MIYGNGMNLENKKILVSHGDSFTQGVGFPVIDGKTKRVELENNWSSLLAKKYEMRCINLGQEGKSNEGIARDLLYYFSKTEINFDNFFVVIGWTNYIREEFYEERNNSWCSQTNFREHDTMKDYVTYWKTPENDYRKTIISKLVIQNYLKLHKIPYLFFDTFNNDFREEDRKYNPTIGYRDDNSLVSVITSSSYYPLGDFKDQLLDKKFYDNKIFWDEIEKMGWDYSYMPDDGHPNEIGHEHWANYLKEVIDGT
tara:strand:+ start:36 stop:800 length:765 start_codon:yes stop_codon:yes gene_type:complete